MKYEQAINAINEHRAADLAAIAECNQNIEAYQDAVNKAEQVLKEEGGSEAEKMLKLVQTRLEMYKQQKEELEEQPTISREEMNALKKDLLEGIDKYNSEVMEQIRKYAAEIIRLGNEAEEKIDSVNEALDVLEIDLYKNPAYLKYGKAARLLNTEYGNYNAEYVSGCLEGALESLEERFQIINA